MAKTCIRVEACNIGSSERHNLRSKELDYIRPELTHRNEQWVECSIAEVHRDITEKYKEATGQGLQKKATPIREGVIVISEETTIQQLQDLAEKLEERFGVHAFQIYTHKDEGANVWDGKEEAWKPNYHAHMIFDWTDGHTGKTVKLNRHDMAEMQTITAECLNMERGVSSDKKHLSAMQYKNKMETEKAEQLQKDIEQLNRAYTAGTEKITTVQKELSTAQKELNSMKTDIQQTPKTVSRLMNINITFFINPPFLKLINKGFAQKYKISPIFALNIKYLTMNRIIHISLLISTVSLFLISNTGCVEKQGYYNHGEESIISLICDITWAGKKTTDENGSVWQGTYKFNKNGTYTRTNIEIDKQGNKKEANIYGQWSFGDPSFSTIYFGGEHYWDIDELTKNKFSFYDRSGKFGDPFMNREYIELTPYQENNTTN